MQQNTEDLKLNQNHSEEEIGEEEEEDKYYEDFLEEENFNDDENYSQQQFLLNFAPLNISNYRRVKHLGSSGFSKIIKIIDKNSRLFYTAKDFFSLIPESFFSNEVTILSQLTHPCIVQYIGYSPFDFNHKNNPIIITEFFKNGSLFEILERERNGEIIEGWNNTSKMINIYGIASAMKYLHSQNILHRNLNTKTVYLTDSFYPKIVDFETAKKMSDPFDLNVIGTASYISPEIWRNVDYSKPGDVYAFAMNVYEIFVGKIPFENLNDANILYRVSYKKERPKIKGNVPAVIKNLITSCWNEDKDLRPSFEDIVNQLKENRDFIFDGVNENDYFSFIEMNENKSQSYKC